VGANNADLRALARAILSKSRGALEARTAAGQVSHAAYAAGTGEDSQIQAHNPAVPLSHALGLGQRDTSASKPKSVGGTPAWDTNGTVGQPYGVVLTALRKGCPEMVDAADWLQALRDAESAPVGHTGARAWLDGPRIVRSAPGAAVLRTDISAALTV
jgi:hypothetical protein